MPKELDVSTLSRGQLLLMAQKLTGIALEAKEAEKHAGKPNLRGTSRDPAVRVLAAIGMQKLRKDNLSFDEIGTLLGVSKERAFQLHKDLLGRLPEETPTL